MVRAADRLYRALHRGVLSRLPEPTAVALGQWTLRVLPLDRLAIFRNTDPRLAVTLGGVALPNPLILSSMYYDTRVLRRAMGLGFGAVTTKSITRGPRPGHPPPNLVRVETADGPGLVNCNGFKNPGLEAYRRALAGLPHRTPLIVAAAGESVEEYVEVVAGLEEFGDLVEINISSPNTRLVYEWSTRPAELERLFRTVRTATRKPLIVKVSPDYRQSNEEAIIRPPSTRDRHRHLREHAARGGAPPFAEERGPLRPRAVRGHAGQCTSAARPLRHRPRDHRVRGIDAPARPAGPSRRGRTPAPTSPDLSPGARSWPGSSWMPSSTPGNNPQVIHLSTGIHRSRNRTL